MSRPYTYASLESFRVWLQTTYTCVSASMSLPNKEKKMSRYRTDLAAAIETIITEASEEVPPVPGTVSVTSVVHATRYYFEV